MKLNFIEYNKTASQSFSCHFQEKNRDAVL